MSNSGGHKTTLERLKSISLRGYTDSGQFQKIQEICKCFVLSDDDLRRVMDNMRSEMEKGLSETEAPRSSLKMLPSFVRAVPNGTEQGDFLALDLGGTNFRVLLVKIKGNEAEMSGKIYRVPEHIMKGSGIALFDHIADCLARFMEENGLKEGQKLPLGFTFSFPCDQVGLTVAKLISWTKGFNASGCVGKDVVQLLREAIARRGDIDVDVVAFLNDTVGTQMACAFKENSC
ncbi:hypothetical protein AB6A40_007960, partial [Gnathostoma spinigerum]